MPITDNFDSYTDGDLNGQGSWSGSVNFDVEGTVVQAGTKAVEHVTAASGNIDKVGTAAATGVQTVYGRSADTSIDDQWGVILREGATSVIKVKTNAGNLQYFNGTIYVTIGAVSSNTWYKLDIEWKASDDTARYRIDDGTWTAFDSIWSPITTGVDTVRFSKGNANATAVYWDSLSNGAAAGGTERDARELTSLGVG